MFNAKSSQPLRFTDRAVSWKRKRCSTSMGKHNITAGFIQQRINV